jgi:hypothetical protein
LSGLSYGKLGSPSAKAIYWSYDGSPSTDICPQTASPSATIQVDLSYYIGGTLFHEIRGIGVVSKGIIDIKVTDLTIIPDGPSPGQIFSITVTLTN